MQRRIRTTPWRIWTAAAALTVCANAALAASATILGADGRSVGKAELQQLPHAVWIRLEVSDLPPGWHGLHIHRVGVCAGPDFRSADVHFDPESRRHGHAAEGGPHAGDLPNFWVAPNGEAKVDILAAQFTLEGGPNAILDGDGAALVVHAKPDDYRSHPSGESGARIACGEIKK